MIGNQYFLNYQDNILVKPNIDIRITSNILIIISLLGLTSVSEKQIYWQKKQLISWVFRYILHLITKILDHL